MLKKIVFMGLAAFASLSFADSDSVIREEFPIVWQPIITFSAGPSWAFPGQNQYIYPVTPPPAVSFYTYQSLTDILGSGEIFFGLQRIVQPNITGQLGIGLAGSTNARLQGVAAVDKIPDVYAYQYKVNQGRLDLKGKLISNYFKALQPYLSGSFGVGFNNSHDYTPVSFRPVRFPAPYFASRTTYAFAYTLGVGVQTMVSPHWQLGMGYEFADWGKSFLEGDNVNYNQGLSLTHLYTNELLFSVGYVF